MLARIDRVNVGIDQLTAVIEQMLAPYGEQLAQAGSMPGWGRWAAPRFPDRHFLSYFYAAA